LADAPSAVGAPTLAEAALVLQARLGPQGLADLHGFLVELDVHAIPFGDCLTYAVAKLSGLPLLCVGGDFPQTDLTLAPPP
jgi:ribonuclease VapC